MIMPTVRVNSHCTPNSFKALMGKHTRSLIYSHMDQQFFTTGAEWQFTAFTSASEPRPHLPNSPEDSLAKYVQCLQLSISYHSSIGTWDFYTLWGSSTKKEVQNMQPSASQVYENLCFQSRALHLDCSANPGGAHKKDCSGNMEGKKSQCRVWMPKFLGKEKGGLPNIACCSKLAGGGNQGWVLCHRRDNKGQF